MSDGAPLAAARRALATQPMLEGLSESELERLAAIAEPFSLPPGGILFREGDPGDHVFITGNGRLEAVMRLPGGAELEALPIGPGELVGEMAAIARLPRQWSVRAIEPVTGWALAAGVVGAVLGGVHAAQVGERLAGSPWHACARRTPGSPPSSRRTTGSPRPARPSSLDLAGPVLAVEPEEGEIAYLSTILFFSAFNREEIAELVGGLRRLHAPRGATLIAPATGRRCWRSCGGRSRRRCAGEAPRPARGSPAPGASSGTSARWTTSRAR